MRNRSIWYGLTVLLLIVSFGMPTAISQDALDPGDFPGFDDPNSQTPSAEEEALRQTQIDELNQQAKAKADAGDLKGALEAYEEIILTPETQNFESLLQAGRILKEFGETNDAIRYLGAAAQLSGTLEDPTEALPLYLELGDLFLDTEQYNNAISTYSQALLVKGQSRNPEILYKIGVARSEYALNQQYATAQTKQEELTQALDFFDKAIRQNPNYADALYERGNTHVTLGQLTQSQDSVDKGLEDFVSAVEADPANTDAIAQLGITALQRGLGETMRRKAPTAKILRDLNMARDALSRYLALVPEDQEIDEEDSDAIRRENVLVNRSAALMGLAEELPDQATSLYEQAIADADAAIAIEPEKDDAHFQKGLALARLGRNEEAIVSYTEAVELFPINPDYLLRRGIVHFRLGEYELAKTDLELSIRNSRGLSSRGYFWLGLCHQKLEEFHQAVTEYTRAIRYSPNYEFALVNRGLAYMKMGRYDRAREDFNKVVLLNPKNAQAISLREQAIRYARTSS